MNVALLTGILLFMLTPLAWLVMTSVKPARILLADTPQFFFEPTLDHYRAIFGDTRAPITHFFTNSLVVTVAATVLSVVVGLLAAFALTRLRPRGAKSLGLGILLMRMMPPVALLLPFFLAANWLNIYDTQLALILAYTGLNVPLVTWILQGFMLDLPRELEEAAWIDGATLLQTFFRVILPLCGPGIAAAAIFAMVLPWNDLAIALTLAPFDATTLPPFAARVRTDVGVAWGQLGAITTLIILPVLAFCVVAGKWLVGGLTSDAVKQ